jgi:drug/metabolite transporter (DMT)-like permease
MTLSSIGPLAVVANILLGKYVLKEKVSILSYVACGLLLIGSLVTLLYSNYSNEKFDIK